MTTQNPSPSLSAIVHVATSTALNHHLVVHRITGYVGEHNIQSFEYTWNHSMTIELWRVYEPRKTHLSNVEVYPHRQLIATLDAVAPDGDPATLQDVKRIALMHGATLRVSQRTANIHAEQY